MKDKVLSKANPVSIVCHSLRFQVFPEKGDVRSLKNHTGGREYWRLPRPRWESLTPTDSPGMLWVKRDLRDQPLPIPFHLLQALSNLASDISRDGAAMTSLGNPFQGLTTITRKNFFPKSHLNPPFDRVKPFPVIPSLQVFVQVHVQFFWRPSRHWKLLQGFPGGFSSPDFCWSGSASRSDLQSHDLSRVIPLRRRIQEQHSGIPPLPQSPKKGGISTGCSPEVLD